MLDKAIRIAAQEFEGRFDKQGKPYVLHCLQVMQDCGSTEEEVLCAAVLHDLFEDYPEWDMRRLLSEGMSTRVCKLVDILTHYEVHTYDQYINYISKDPDAIMIKLADLRHNSDITRLKDIHPKDIERMEKYHKAYKYLTECLKQHSQA